MTDQFDITDLSRRHIAQMVPLRQSTTRLHRNLHPSQFRSDMSARHEIAEIRRHMPRIWRFGARERFAIGAFEGDTLRGYLLYSKFNRAADSLLRSGRVVMVNDIAVDPDQRGRGVGLALVNALRRRVDDGHVAEIIAIIWEGNERSTALFHRAGFVPTFTYHSLALGTEDGA